MDCILLFIILKSIYSGSKCILDLKWKPYLKLFSLSNIFTNLLYSYYPLYWSSFKGEDYIEVSLWGYSDGYCTHA